MAATAHQAEGGTGGETRRKTSSFLVSPGHPRTFACARLGPPWTLIEGRDGEDDDTLSPVRKPRKECARDREWIFKPTAPQSGFRAL
ncbi:hypothetical protein CORC01_11194 [Colletotrichum orchidophilum]|uniref:Uncharacterized protein n=1 Tax=Colletotrichum orchidophilum TaxID=1209926 RepID=A0A1G4AWG5_9PEZI|nr:uncharacterized protein CORC01_11194 [Colletotrichum orchidophilum]OHE93508.1 hypothetical protein CORC01_11194 [Colletotrichum orchidophilum]